MIDALNLTGPLAHGPSATVLAQASTADVDRFKAAMMAPPQADLVPPASNAAQPTVQAPGGTGPAPSLGDTILGTLQDLSADTRQRYAQIGEVLAKPDLNMSDLMSLQFTLLQTSLQFEIASKGISKLAQNIDSVLKTQ
jgi:hypothetical protein